MKLRNIITEAQASHTKAVDPAMLLRMKACDEKLASLTCPISDIDVYITMVEYGLYPRQAIPQGVFRD